MNTLIRLIRDRGNPCFLSRYPSWFALLILDEIVLPGLLSAIAESYTREIRPFMTNRRDDVPIRISVN